MSFDPNFTNFLNFPIGGSQTSNPNQAGQTQTQTQHRKISNGNFLTLNPSSTIIQVDKNDLYDLRNINGKNFRKRTLNKTERPTSPSKTYLLQDYKFSDRFIQSTDTTLSPKIQKLILRQFQPYQMLTLADILDQGILKQMSDVIFNGFIGSITAPILKVGGKWLTNDLMVKTMKSLAGVSGFADYNIYKEGVVRQRKYFTSDPIQMVHNMFNGGIWLNTYQLPYFGGSYLKGAYSGNWSVGGADGFFGKSISQSVTNRLGINFPSNPKFNPTMDSTRDNLSFQFYLINTNDQWLRKNFQFLNAIYAGTNWLHLKYCFIRPPNVYHVECPGRFRMYWAAMDCTVTFQGKLRRNDAVTNSLRNENNRSWY